MPWQIPAEAGTGGEAGTTVQERRLHRAEREEEVAADWELSAWAGGGRGRVGAES